MSAYISKSLLDTSVSPILLSYYCLLLPSQIIPWGSCGTSWRELAIVLFEKNIARRSKLAGTPQGLLCQGNCLNNPNLYCPKVLIATNYFSPQFLRSLPYCSHIHRKCSWKETLCPLCIYRIIWMTSGGIKYREYILSPENIRNMWD